MVATDTFIKQQLLQYTSLTEEEIDSMTIDQLNQEVEKRMGRQYRFSKYDFPVMTE